VSRSAKFYLVIGLVLVGAFDVAAASGWTLGGGPIGFVPADIRQSPGGYRSFHFWHSGYQGGK
jgi:hypothetical protein